MKELDQLINNLESHNIKIIYCHIPTAVTLKYDDRFFILVNDEANDIDKYWMLEHEYSHLLLDNLYETDTPIDEIEKIEDSTNINLIYRCHLIAKVYELVMEGYTEEQICYLLKIDSVLYKSAYKEIMLRYMEGLVQ